MLLFALCAMPVCSELKGDGSVEGNVLLGLWGQSFSARPSALVCSWANPGKPILRIKRNHFLNSFIIRAKKEGKIAKNIWANRKEIAKW